jgi:adenine-specific DNA-methyltransferase
MDNEKLELKTEDIVSSNIDKIASIFPNCVTEGTDGKVIDFDLLKQELSHQVVEGTKERYRLEWPGKKEAIVTANIPSTKTLRLVREDSVDFDNTENIYIEGDNLEVLKLLQESYLSKIKYIYIDPPYNTGNDFIYKDDFKRNTQDELVESGQVDEYNNRLLVNPSSSGRYHSDWLSLMYPRLKLARNLLTNDGLIFISIDDNEIDNLKKLCVEIFGENNFISQVIWKSKYGAGAKTNGFIDVHEYILCFSKNPIESLDSPISEEAKKSYNKTDEKFEMRGGYFTQPLMTTSMDDRPNLQYSIVHNGVEIKPRKQWVWSKERLEKAIENNEVVFSIQKDGTYSVRSKQYLIDEHGKERKGKPISVLNGPFTQEGTSEIKELFGENIFGFTKPVSLIEYLLSFTVNQSDLKDAIILDFFSGSGTTAQAVMSKNSKELECMKYILVQIPEPTPSGSDAYKAGYNTICEIGKERIRKAAKKIKEETGASIDYGFRVFRLDDSNMQDVYYRPTDYTQTNLELFADNVKPDRTPEDLLVQVMLDWGLSISLKIETKTVTNKQVFIVADNSLIACFDKEIDEAFAKEIAVLQPLRIVFRDNSFKNDTAKSNVKQLLKQLSPNTEMKVI